MRNFNIPEKPQILNVREFGDFANNSNLVLFLHIDIDIYKVIIKVAFNSDTLLTYVAQIKLLTKGKVLISSQLIYEFIINVLIKNISHCDK